MFRFVFYFERERESVREQGRGRERGRERIPSRFCTLRAEPGTGFEFTDCELMA